jgi:hypothetical protein
MAKIKKSLKKAQNGTKASVSTRVPEQDKGLYDKKTSSGIQTKNVGDKKVSTLKTEYTKRGFPTATENVRRMSNPNAKVNDTISSFRKKADISDKTLNAPTDTFKYSIRRPGGVENVSSSTAQLGGVPQTKSTKTFTKSKSGSTIKKKMKNGGSLTGLTASNKRVGPVDPKGAFTKVQEKTLAGAKGKASLAKDKQLGATKMTAKAGKKVSKKK